MQRAADKKEIGCGAASAPFEGHAGGSEGRTRCRANHLRRTGSGRRQIGDFFGRRAFDAHCVIGGDHEEVGFPGY